MPLFNIVILREGEIFSVYNLIVGFLSIVILVMVCFIIGQALNKDKENTWLSIIVGYCAITSVLGLFGIIVQFLDINWKIYCAISVGLILIAILFIIFSNRFPTPEDIKRLLRSETVIVFVSIILVAISMMYVGAYWYNNHLDDGYYMTRIAALPYQSTYNINPSTGFPVQVQLNRIINTYENEAAIPIFLLKLNAFSFCRIFMSFFHYFILGNLITVLYKKIHNDLSDFRVQLSVVIIVFFSFCEFFLYRNKLFLFQDANQFITAMYYGSSMSRVMGILFLILPFVDLKINLEKIIFYIVICIMLMTRSSIALPVVFVTTVVIIHAIAIKYREYLKILISDAIFLIITVLLFILKRNDSSVSSSISYFSEGLSYYLTPVMITALVIIIISFILNESGIKRNIIALLAGISILIYIPVLNIWAACTSMYKFVAGRMMTTFGCTIIIIAFMCLMDLLERIKIRRIATAIISFCLLVIGSYYSFYSDGGNVIEDGHKGNILKSYDIALRNNKMVPNSTIELGDILSHLDNETSGKLRIVMQNEVLTDGLTHNPSIIIRSFTPNSEIISATIRYPVNIDYTSKDQWAFQKFDNKPNSINANKFVKVIHRFDINTVITSNELSARVLEKYGFKLIDHVSTTGNNTDSYFVLFRH